MKLTDQQDAEMKAIMSLAMAASSAQRALAEALRRHGNNHVIIKKQKSASCVICGKDLGWWCPKSPDHTCEYDRNDLCIHCGDPSERK